MTRDPDRNTHESPHQNDQGRPFWNLICDLFFTETLMDGHVSKLKETLELTEHIYYFDRIVTDRDYE